MKRGGLEQKAQVLFVAIDESNHGRDDEIFPAIFSTDINDLREGNFPKIRKHQKHQPIKSIIGEREYSFTILQKALSDRIPQYQLIGTIVSSLLQDVRDFEKLHIFLDGMWTIYQKGYLTERTAHLLNRKESSIKLECGKRYDQKFFSCEYGGHSCPLFV